MSSSVIKGIYPENVFYFFEEISKIPRGSGKEEAISNWLVKFAKDRNLEVYQDKYFNVVIKKPATSGYEKYQPLILQGHTDMVWEKNKNVDFDFETQGINLEIKDGFLVAKGTTLGADNGIAVALALAVLDSNNLKHPALEILLTTDEEVNMTGAENLDVSILKSKKMINLDTEEDGVIYVSSAGGATIKLITESKNYEINKEEKIYSLDILGLKGGHSGAEIHLPLGNSNKILVEALNSILKNYEINIVSIDGGNKGNAIPRESNAIFTTNISEENLKDILIRYIKIKREEFKEELNLDYSLKEINNNNFKKLSIEDSKNLVKFYMEYPHGVVSMSKNIEGLVQTSLNFGVVKTKILKEKTVFTINSLLRSSSVNELDNLQDRLLELAKKYNTKGEKVPSFYPWEYKENSTLRELTSNVFKKEFNKNIEIKAIHAGLECGIFAKKIKDLDVISFGPNIFGAHTPEERMEISSVALTWNFLVKLLEEYNLEK